MAQQKTIARKYAKGLYQACQPSDLMQVKDGLNKLAKTFTDSAAVGSAIKNPAISETDKAAVLLTLVDRLAGSNKLLSNLMRTLVENQRASALPEVAMSFDEIVSHHFKMSQIQILSARALEADEKSGYETSLKNQLGSQTQVSFAVEPALLGGMQVKVGDILIDGSIQTALQQLRSTLLG